MAVGNKSGSEHCSLFMTKWIILLARAWHGCLSGTLQVLGDNDVKDGKYNSNGAT